MPKPLIWILAAAVALFILSVVAGNRIAAGGGALLLLGGIAYGYVHNRGGSREEIARAEAGARQVREEIAEDEDRRGMR